MAVGDFTPYSYTTPRFVPGLDIIVSDLALKDSDERLFPFSKHRSRRIHKKLIKRFGGEFRKVPCIWRMTDKIMMHPALYAELQRQTSERLQRQTEQAIFGTLTPAHRTDMEE